MTGPDGAGATVGTAFVTGAGSGIGRGIAHALARRGLDLALADIDPVALERVAGELTGTGVEVLTLELDVSDQARMQECAEATYTRFGGVDLLVNNAGVSNVRNPVWAMPDTDIRWQVEVNLFGVINGVQAFVPRMIAAGRGGRVLTTSSVGGFVCRPNSRWHSGLYCTTKYAVTALCESLEIDLEPHGIGVSVLAPFFVSTGIASAERNRQGRFGGPTAETESEVGQQLDGGLDAMLVGEQAAAGALAGEMYIFTSRDEGDLITRRHRRVEAALAAAPDAVEAARKRLASG